MDEPSSRWRRTINPDRSLDPTYARPEPWFVGSGKGLMIGVLVLVAILIVARVATTAYAIENWYAWWRAPIPTMLPQQLPIAVERVAPRGNPGAWFTSDDYPTAARRAGQEGRVSISLLIDPAGRPSACEVTVSSGSTSLDEATCRIAVRRGHFRPARDAAGQAIEAKYILPGVRWKLEG